MKRLNKFLAESGMASRRGADKLILENKVLVNGKVAKLGDKVSERDRVVVNGQEINKAEEKEYFSVYKPVGYVSTANDEWGRPKVTDLVNSKNRLYPVGRLDKNSEGLMILTNDGELTLRLTHPRYHLEKEYEVETDRKIDFKKINTGQNKIIWRDGNKMKIIMYEGKKRQIRNMCWEAGLRVKKLKRVRMGKLVLGNMEAGEVRRLGQKEIKELI
jgi:23S rRNA pseudouridine2605 synthase